ncbi:hypothetical protein K435DRAFT_856961 [Dendrothele bispora CBS 962.96]|uniref:Uncharacterized protein n=1 Tax=Dendrothele bispora (strain CBS 962.96) TaxID=1314807 RepID=A0A4S8M752_DENBC|nr:hypothetical protein K435DRAFT_856961 [Dendrothele bispora CBS 962.96]
MASSDVTIVADETLMTFGNDDLWSVSGVKLWYGGTSRWAEFANSSMLASFTLQFEGTSIAFIGSSPQSSLPQSFRLSIDGSEDVTMTYPEPELSFQWYMSPILEDSLHQIEISELIHTNVDFAVITVGDNTSLTGQTIILDDSSPEITWNGKWQEETNQTFDPSGSGEYHPIRPLKNGTHTSTSVGDSMTFQFAGTAIDVYGIFNWNLSGSVVVDFTIDGTSNTSKSFSATIDRPDRVDVSLNYLLFNTTGLSSGNHTLKIDVADVVGSQSFTIDYLTYQPSFNSLRDKPDFTSMSAGSGTSSTATIDASPSGGTGPIATESPMPVLRHVNIRKVVGSVVGSVAVLSVLAIFLWCRRSRRVGTPLNNRSRLIPRPLPITSGNRSLGNSSGTARARGLKSSSPGKSESLHRSTSLAGIAPTSAVQNGPVFDSNNQSSGGTSLEQETAARMHSYFNAIFTFFTELQRSGFALNGVEGRHELGILPMSREGEYFGAGSDTPPPSYRPRIRASVEVPPAPVLQDREEESSNASSDLPLHTNIRV